ncbi:carboxypeptidase-like regulatory domain-containing protein [Kordia sp.]|uniref:carboxypeptidase-like regulatory domain-containing protein n=1 Tax=Kordia sp. TaxID=1965332 RepID=UPI003B5B1BC6
MKREAVFLYITIFFLVFACSTKNRVCSLEVADISLQEKIPSVIKINEYFRIADTATASISGKIYGESLYSDEKFQKDDILPFVNIALTNTETQKIVGTTTDLDGTYKITIPAATYQIEIQFIGYNLVVIENVQLGTGEILNLSANLGQGIDKEYFEIRKHSTIRELIRKTN